MPSSAPVQAQTPFESAILSDGTCHAHFGIRFTPEDRLAVTLENTVKFLRDFGLRSGAKFDSTAKILDLGSGDGGAAHYLASKHSCHVTCLDHSRAANACNISVTTALGLTDRIETVTASFGEEFPEQWTNNFDVIWCLHSLSQIESKNDVMKRIVKALKPGGILILSDVVRAPAALPQETNAYIEYTHPKTKPLISLRQYELMCEDMGLQVMRTRDLGAHVMQTHKLTIKHGKTIRSQVKGCTPEQVDVEIAKVQALVDALEKSNGHGWGALTAYKPVGDGSDGKLKA